MSSLSQSRSAYLLFRLAGALAPYLPPGVGYPFFALIGNLAHAVNADARANVRDNLRHVLGPEAGRDRVHRLARLTFQNLAYNYYDLFRLPNLTGDRVETAVRVLGWEHVEAALSLGKGVVLASAHLGFVEMVPFILLRRGASIAVPVEPIQPAGLHDYLTRLRTGRGTKLIPVGGSMLELYRTLRRGGIAGITADRNVAGNGRLVSLFGAPARLPDGHVRLALLTGSPLVLGFCRRLQRDSYQATFLPAFRFPVGGRQEQRLAAGMEYVLRGLEEAVAGQPEQWVVTARVWENQALSTSV